MSQHLAEHKKTNLVWLSHCSNYLKDLPLVMVFGIATAVTAVHRLMPHAVSSLLSMEKFQAPPSSEYLSHLIDKVNTGKS